MKNFSGKNLACIRGERGVFDNLSFALEPGEMLILSGPNGSGKSSLLRLMAGLLMPAKGALEWNSINIYEDPENHYSRFHYIGHPAALKPTLSVVENLKFWANIRGVPKRDGEQIANGLAAWGISGLANIPVQHLSAGQTKRVALARLLITFAPLWLLDEPATSLDTQAVAVLENLIAHHRQAGGMVVLSTHSDIKAENPAELDLSRFSSAANLAEAL